MIVVAGGKGLRMGGDVPKQFQLLAGKPILMHTLTTLYHADKEMKLILVLPTAQQDYWRELCKKYQFDLPVRLADGGKTRFDSVKNGLACVPDGDNGVVCVHDGVRPFVSEKVVLRCVDTAKVKGTAVPVVNVVETLRKVDDNGFSKTVSRDNYRLVQTPQAFLASLLKKAYQQPYDTAFTDDASVVERMGGAVTLVEGNRENIKITTPFDLCVGEALVQKR